VSLKSHLKEVPVSTILSWISDVAGLSLGQVGGVDVTLGLIIAAGAVASLAVGFIRKVRRL
jgi:hypothetical protein